MAKTQLNVRLDPDLADAAKMAAASRRTSVQDYIADLVRNDVDPLRAAFLGSAENVISEFGDFIEERANAPRG